MSAGANVFIHRSQFPSNIRAELLRSLRSREINHKFHYDSVKQAHRWLAVHEAHSPARTDAACLDIYDEAFKSAAVTIKGRRVRLVGLGCGGGQKDARLIQLLSAANRAVRYVPCDVSLPLVLIASDHASTTSTHPVVCDLALSQGDFLPAALRGEKRLLAFFGMLPNFDPDVIVPKLAAMMGWNDLLIFSANLVPALNEAAMRQILPQYDNPLTHAWLMTFLEDLGVEKDDGTLRFSIDSAPGRTPLPRFVARYTFGKRRIIRFESGEEFVFKRGDHVRLFFSSRYTPETVIRTFASYQIAIMQSFIAPSKEEGVFLAKKLR